MQTFTNEQQFTYPLDIVLGRFTDPQFLVRKYRELGRQDIVVLEHVRDTRSARMRIAYSDAPDMELPDFARRLVPARSSVVQSVEWDLARHSGRLSVEPKGVPAKVEAQMQLSASGGGCRNTIRWQVSVGVPLIGGKLEKLLVEGLRQKASRDAAVTQRLLSE